MRLALTGLSGGSGSSCRLPLTAPRSERVGLARSNSHRVVVQTCQERRAHEEREREAIRQCGTCMALVFPSLEKATRRSMTFTSWYMYGF